MTIDISWELIFRLIQCPQTTENTPVAVSPMRVAIYLCLSLSLGPLLSILQEFVIVVLLLFLPLAQFHLHNIT